MKEIGKSRELIGVEAIVLRKPGSRAPCWAPTRKSLLARLKDWRDDESWKVFFDTYSHLLYFYAMRAGLTDAEAQDVVQETVICVCKSIQRLEYDPSRGTFKHWLWVMTQRRIGDYFRRRKKIASADGEDHPIETNALPERLKDIVDPSPSLYAIWEAEWEQSLWEAALEKVRAQASATQYQIFDLYVIKACKMAEVKKVFGVTAASVYLAKHRVGRMLRREFERLRDKPFEHMTPKEQNQNEADTKASAN